MRGSRGAAADPCLRCAPRVEALERENQQLRRRIQDLEGLIEEARRSAKRQAAPFSKGPPKAHPKRPGRRPGRAYGVRARRPIPERIDEVVEVPLPEMCPRCREPAEAQAEHVVDQYQTDIPPVRPHVTHFRIHCGFCGRCGGRIRGRHPRQTSQAVGAAASQLGPRAVALAADLNKRGGLTYGKVVALYRTAFGLVVSRGGLCQALQRLARAAEPTYKGLIQTVRESDRVSPDETGWKVAGQLRWLWVFVTAEVTVYAVQPGRGFENAAEILTPEFDGCLVRDGWAPYRRFTEAEHQTCLRHLLTRCNQMIEVAQRGAARFPHSIRRLLGTALDLRDRYEDGEISPHGLAVARGRLEAKQARPCACWPDHAPAESPVSEAPHD